jgi:hypothetical protein
MNDFTEFDAFQLCREFARAIAVPLNGGYLRQGSCPDDAITENDYFHLFEFR